MPPAVLALLTLLQSPAPSVAVAPNCASPTDAVIATLCTAEDLMRRAATATSDPKQRDTSWQSAAESFRRAADLTRDPAQKKFALEQIEIIYDEKHLDRALDADPILRELIGLSPGDLTVVFRLVHVLERERQFDAAESTLLGVHQMDPEAIEPNRELAQFFARRAAALSASKDAQDRADQPGEASGPDKDGIYQIGGGVEAPQKTSPEQPVKPPADAAAAGIGGSVSVEIVVGTDGQVTDAKVVRSVPMLDAAALAAVRQWQYAPGTLNGHPVPVRMTVVVNF